MKKLILLFVVSTMFIGCKGKEQTFEERQKEIYEQQKDINVYVIAKSDGVTLYRVRDVSGGGTVVYFTGPSGTTQWTVPGDDGVPSKTFNVGNIKK